MRNTTVLCPGGEADHTQTCQVPRPVQAANFPGGVARQFRVQLHDGPCGGWQMHATFKRREDAESCIRTLVKRGQEARLVAYACCPTAC